MLDVGSGPGFLAKHIDPEITQRMILVDSSRGWRFSSSEVCRHLSRADTLAPCVQERCSTGMKICQQRVSTFSEVLSFGPCQGADLTSRLLSVPLERIHLDEEALASHFEENSHDCIMSCLSMHWINDLPGEHSFSRQFAIGEVWLRLVLMQVDDLNRHADPNQADAET